MTNDKISAILSLLAAVIITVVNFYPWYVITYNGAPKVKKWGKIVLFLCIALIISSTVLLFYPKNNVGIESSQEKIQDAGNKNIVKLVYNESTGELYPILPEGVSIHSCVWTISGDHGSDTKLVTDSSFIDNETDEKIKNNNFLPPRVPIYVSCVDWQNNVYSGSIGEY